MNYRQSALILEKIKKAKKILVNCHTSPDADSIGSALAMYEVLEKLKKKAEIICPDRVPRELKFLRNYTKIKEVNFTTFDFSQFDLFIVLDTSSWDRVVGIKGASQPEIPLVVVDHHDTTQNFGNFNLIDSSLSSTSELLYLIFQDWGIQIDKWVATDLLAGILGDTGVFQFPGTSVNTLTVASVLIGIGADKDEIILHLNRSLDFDLIRFTARVLESMEFDKDNKFVWSAIDYQTYVKLGRPQGGKDFVAGMFAGAIKDTDFGMIILEYEKNKISVSLRSRTDFDVSEIAVALGGGGHTVASGARLESLLFKEAVETILKVAREFVRNA